MRPAVALALLSASGCDLVFAPGKGPNGTGIDAPIPDDGEVLTTDAYVGDGPELPDASPDGNIALDTDGDLINDAVDNCVMVQNPQQHNEDGDLLGDECDPCPHIHGALGADVDDDSDGVGNACDPRVLTAGDTSQFFGFNNGNAIDGWTQTLPGQWMVSAGSVVSTNDDAPNAALISTTKVVNAAVTIGVRGLGQVPGSVDHYVGVIAGSSPPDHEYECQASRPAGGSAALRLRQMLDGDEMIVDTAWAGGELIGREIQLTATLSEIALTCQVRTEPNGDPQAGLGTTIVPFHGGRVGFESYLIRVAVDWMFIAHMP